MTVTAEQEIKDLFYSELRGAIEDCEALAKLPVRGPTFIRMRERLKKIENCCRQMAAWRADTRWLPIGILMEGAHQISRKWIVKHHKRQLFMTLADRLRLLLNASEDLDRRATGRLGMILPPVMPAPIRTESRPVQVLAPRSGLILPPGYH
jgi:hypothetical protein